MKFYFQFEKQYSYNIRHSYGKEGKRANYTPYNCMKIIMQNIGAGEQHGCPFKHADKTFLMNKMLNYGLPSTGKSGYLFYLTVKSDIEHSVHISFLLELRRVSFVFICFLFFLIARFLTATSHQKPWFLLVQDFSI